MRKTTGMMIAAACLLMSGAASAADMYGGSMKDGAVPAPIWYGLYGGINVAGLLDGESEFDIYPGVAYPYDTDNVDISGILAGAHLGYSAQYNKFVFGLEGDAAFGKTGDPTTCPYSGGVCETDIKSLYSLRARLGVALRDNLLFYGTGGLAIANVDHTVDAGMIAFEASSTTDGVVYGGGLEYMHSSGVTVGVEALHYDFEAERFNLTGGITGGTLLYDIDTDMTVIRGRVGFHFN